LVRHSILVMPDEEEMTDNNIEYFWKMLRDEKIILDKGDMKRFRVHPSFEPILMDNLYRNQHSVMDGLMLSVQSYCPTASDMQLSVICNFLAGMIREDVPTMWKQLSQEMAIAKIKRNKSWTMNFDNAINCLIKDEQDR